MVAHTDAEIDRIIAQVEREREEREEAERLDADLERLEAEPLTEEQIDACMDYVLRRVREE